MHAVLVTRNLKNTVKQFLFVLECNIKWCENVKYVIAAVTRCCSWFISVLQKIIRYHHR